MFSRTRSVWALVSRARLSAVAFLLLTCAAVGIAPAPAWAATYYVAANGSDNNNGTESSPFRQIRKTIPLLRPGDTVLVSDGDYLGFDIKQIHGTLGAPITIRATGRSVNILPSSDRATARGTIYILESSYITIDGLRAFDAYQSGVAVRFSSYCTVRNGVFGNNGWWGIFSAYSDYLLLENNECYGSLNQHGIYVSNSCTGPILRNNHCHDNPVCGIHVNGDASSGIGSGLVTAGRIEGNVLYNNGTKGGSGINLDGVQTTLIANNLLYNNHAKGITLYVTDGAAGPAGNLIVNNTIVMAENAWWNIKIADSAGPNLIRNNILLHMNPRYSGITYDNDNDTTDSDYNIMADVQRVAAWEKNSLSANVSSVFLDYSNRNFRLAANSPALDRGQTLANVVSDIEGNLRPRGLAADIGCFESNESLVIHLSRLSLSVASIRGGNYLQGTVTLSHPTPAPVTVLLAASNSAARPAQRVTVAAGAQSATFSIATYAVPVDTRVTLSATHNGVTQMAELLVLAPATEVFIKGINLGGAATVVEGNAWLSHAEALASGLSVSNALVGETWKVTYRPTPDAGTKKMLDWGLWTPAKSDGVGFTLRQTLPNGTYKVYVWEVEDGPDYTRNFNLKMQNALVATNLGHQRQGEWKKYGPYTVTVSNGVLKIEVLRNTKGDPQLMGLAIYQ